MIKITVDGGLYRSLQRRVDGSSDHLHDKTTLDGLHKAGQCSKHNHFAFHTSKPIALSNLEKKKKNDHGPLRLLKHHYVTTASNRTLLEKISGVCITLISLLINISQFTRKNAFILEEKGI